MSLSGSSDSRWSSCAITRFAIWSSTGVPRNTMRSARRREYRVHARSRRDGCSTTIAIRGISFLLAAGGPHLLRLRFFLFLPRRPDLLPRSRLVGRDPLRLGDDAVERLLHAELEPH